MRVMKFGGTSVQDATAITNVINIVSSLKNEKIVVVVSAFSKVTDKLIDLYNSIGSEAYSEKLLDLEDLHKSVAYTLLGEAEQEVILKEFAELRTYANTNNTGIETKEAIVSKGERLSSAIIGLALAKAGIKVCHKDSTSLIATDENFGEANVDFPLTYSKIKDNFDSAFNEFDVIICGGFIAKSISGKATTLGRGGSDYSAAIYAGAIEANKLEIWTDVDGILTCDPRLIPNAKKISQMSYKEAGELAYFGAKVLHPKTILPAIEKNIPVIVKNTFNPNGTGTTIVANSKNIQTIKAIAFRKNITIINVTSNRMLGAYGFLAKVFEIFKANETSVDIVTTSEVSISLTIDDTKNLEKIKAELEQFSSVEISSNNAVISVVGDGIKLTAGIAAKFFGVLKGTNILMVSFGASEVNLTIMVQEADLEASVKLLHSEFFDLGLDSEIFDEI